jgi:hypothetical protein
VTALGRHRTFEAPLTASDRARLVSYHRTQLARFEPVHDAVRGRKRRSIFISICDPVGATPRPPLPASGPTIKDREAPAVCRWSARVRTSSPPRAPGSRDQDPVGSRLMLGDQFIVGDHCGEDGFSLKRDGTRDNAFGLEAPPGARAIADAALLGNPSRSHDRNPAGLAARARVHAS